MNFHYTSFCGYCSLLNTICFGILDSSLVTVTLLNSYSPINLSMLVLSL